MVTVEPWQLRVGAVVSIKTAEPSVTALIGLPSFPPRSLNVTDRAANPSGSVLCTVTVAVHILPTHVTEVAGRPARVTPIEAGSNSSVDVNDRIIVSPRPAGELVDVLLVH